MTALTTQLESALRSLPDAAASEDAATFEVDGLRPGLVIAPGSQEVVVSIIQAASNAGAAVIPWGAGSHMSLGMPPERYDLALDLRRLNRIIEYEPADMTVTVEAGIALASLQQRLGEYGQWLALDPPGDAAATIGGLLATNASGPARHSRGSLRDLLIGIRFVTGDGLTVNAGGRVVKNVAGYDLGKLQIGALGTLGVIVQATFKIAPLPAQTANGHVLGAMEPLLRIRTGLEDARLPIQGLTLATNPGPSALWMLDVRFAGGEASVARSWTELEGLAASEGLQALRANDGAWETHGERVYRNDSAVRVHATVIPTSSASVCQAFARSASAVVSYPSVGVIDAAWDVAPSADEIARLRKLCVDAGGALVLHRAPVELKRSAGVWGDTRGDFALMRRLKDEMDPKRLLNPGRFVGGI